ncbi:hypothetical protein E2C01_048870 [Portunus trituberculatus]|uniref:Uncharacterized protein n=1 Tax=Portunus trituberculatus TaxID=210409 RepID=A0A5B7G4U3_PORTR|nr:hypothetical protein [Portunus trituberculatus]
MFSNNCFHGEEGGGVKQRRWMAQSCPGGGGVLITRFISKEKRQYKCGTKLDNLIGMGLFL